MYSIFYKCMEVTSSFTGKQIEVGPEVAGTGTGSILKEGLEAVL